MNRPSSQLLRNFRLRSTPVREEILHLFLEKDYALSHSDIENEIDEGFDRVTVYRTLRTFSSKGLIHKVLDDRGVLKYALCAQECFATGHRHEHVHFKCTRCGQTNCLDVQIPPVKLPKGYVAEEVNFLVQGTCQHCSI